MRFIPNYWLIAALIVAYHEAAWQSDSLERTTQAFVEAGALVSPVRAVPFWQRANQYGMVPLANSFVPVRVGVSSDYRPWQNRRVDWGYGFEVVGNIGPVPANQQVFLPEAYVKARWRQLEIYAGRRKTIAGLVDTLLTSGAYAMSGNALPYPPFNSEPGAMFRSRSQKGPSASTQRLTTPGSKPKTERFTKR